MEEDEKKELLFLREEVKTHRQVVELILDIFTFLTFAIFLYWMAGLAMMGARYAYSDFKGMQFAQVMIFSLSSLMLVMYPVISNIYEVVQDDAAIWWNNWWNGFSQKFQAASAAWVKSREELQAKLVRK